MSRILTYVEAIREALDQSMERDESVFLMGLGADKPGECDGTVKGLSKKYPGRVFDTPCSEDATTGFCTGAAIAGMRPVIYHGRVEFALFAFDQIVTQAAKWNYMFGGDSPVPAVFRISVGRRWGDAPQHTAVMHSVFGHIPGLKVVIPSTPWMAKELLVAAIEDENPVVFLEHRWLYNIKESMLSHEYEYPLNRSLRIKEGSDLTIVAMADTLIDAMRAVPILQENGIDAEIIDLVSVNPFDHDMIIQSVIKTGRLLVADVGTRSYGVGSEIISTVCEKRLDILKAAPVNLAAPDCPCPMSPALTEKYYPTADTIIDAAGRMCGQKITRKKLYDFWQIHMPPDLDVDELRKGMNR